MGPCNSGVVDVGVVAGDTGIDGGTKGVSHKEDMPHLRERSSNNVGGSCLRMIS